MKRYFVIIICAFITLDAFCQKSSLKELGNAAADAFEKQDFKLIEALLIPKNIFMTLGKTNYNEAIKANPYLPNKRSPNFNKIYKKMLSSSKSTFNSYMNWYKDYEIEYGDLNFETVEQQEGALNSEIITAFSTIKSSTYNYFVIYAIKYSDGWYLSKLPDFEQFIEQNNFIMTTNKLSPNGKFTVSGKITYTDYSVEQVHKCLKIVLMSKNVEAHNLENDTSITRGQFKAKRLFPLVTTHPILNDILIKYQFVTVNGEIQFSFYEHIYEKEEEGVITTVSLENGYTPAMAKLFSKKEFYEFAYEMGYGYEVFLKKMKKNLAEFI